MPETERTRLWWLLAVIGIGVLYLAYALNVLQNIGDLDGKDVGPTIFALIGNGLLVAGLAGGSMAARNLSWPVRVAMLIFAGYIAAGLAAYGFLAALRAAL